MQLRITVRIDTLTGKRQVEMPLTFKPIDAALVLHDVVSNLLAQDAKDRALIVSPSPFQNEETQHEQPPTG
jgi:hypothetical protein